MCIEIKAMDRGVQLQNRDEYEDMMEILLDAGLKTSSGYSFGEYDWFNETGAETVIDLRDLDNIGYGEYQFFIDNNMPVCTFQEFLTEQCIEPNCTCCEELRPFRLSKKDIKKIAKAVVKEMSK